MMDYPFSPHRSKFLYGDYRHEAAFQEPEFLRRKLELLDERIARSGPYGVEEWLLRRLEVMEQLYMSREEMEQFIQKYDNLSKVRQRLMEKWSDKT